MDRLERAVATSKTEHRLWCIAAAEAPIVAVFARIYREGELAGHCILRWNWKKDLLDVGSFTRFRLVAWGCALSEDGEFLRYMARGAPGSAFDTGGWTISRLPYLSALTEINSTVACTPSDHMLTEAEQEVLREKFAVARDPWGGDRHWPEALGTAWKNPDSRLLADAAVRESIGNKPVVHAATARIEGSPVRLLVVTHRKKWDVWGRHLRYFAVHRSSDGAHVAKLNGVTWAYPADKGRAAVALDTGELALMKFSATGPGHRLIGRRAVGKLPVIGRPSPAWARAGLGKKKAMKPERRLLSSKALCRA